MDGWEVLLQEHAATHSAEVSGGKGVSWADQPLHEMPDDQLRRRPHGLNSIAWLIWHIARLEDIVANTILNLRPQVFDEEKWSARLNVSRRDFGVEMTGEEVEELSAAVDIRSVRAYRIAVGRRTREWIRSLSATGLEDVVPEAGVRQAFAEGALGPRAKWVEELWLNRHKPWFLYREITGHNYLHLGQALWVKKLVTADRGAPTTA